MMILFAAGNRLDGLKVARVGEEAEAAKSAARPRDMDGIIDGDRYFMSQHQDPESHRRQVDLSATRTVASATEAICATTGDGSTETACGTASCPDERWHSG